MAARRYGIEWPQHSQYRCARSAFMTRRRLLPLSVFLAVLVTLPVGAWLSRPKPELSRTNILKLDHGMTRTHVEAILGPPRHGGEADPVPGLARRERMRDT